MYDAIIIGAGPAGISAALYLKRANLNVLVIHNNKSALEKAHLIENYYGVKKISGKDLYNLGLEQAQELNIEIINDDVIEISDFIIYTKNNEKGFSTKNIILASGISRSNPSILNLKKFIGNGVSYCASCDGFFYKNKKVVILGNNDYTIKEANYLSNLTKDITILTNNRPLLNTNYKQITKKIKSVEGTEKIEKIIFDDLEEMEIDGLFIAEDYGTVEIASTIGIIFEDNNISVDENMQTNIKNIYAVGDNTMGMMQIAKAVYQGAVAANHIIKNRKMR